MANETAKASIYLEGKQAEAALDSMSRRAKDLKKDFDAAQKAGDTIKMNKLEKELRQVESAQRSLRKESFDTQKVLQNLNGSSFNDLTKALKQSQRELKRMSETDPGYKDKLRDVVTLKTRIKELSDQQAVHTSLWGKMANGANKYFNVMMAGVAIITGVIFSMSQFVKGMLGLDDALADVMKTTGLARREVRGLYVDFRYLNTRTPRRELLALAEEAGRLGKTGKRDIMDFVEVANKIKISLGDDLGGNADEAIRDVGKLTEIYKVGKQYSTDFKTSLEKVGSGLNQVANNSNASAGYLVEYMKRTGGIADQAKISAANIMGYASTFDQLGQNVEMAATAQSKVIVDMFTDPANYARIAKMEVGAFTKLLNTDANEAFVKFLEGLNGNNEGLSVMATKLDDLGIDGARATQALAALSSNTKMVREQQVLANDAMEKGTSLQTEYAIKNENLAGSWAKVTAIIQAKFINSGFISFLEKVVGKISEWMQQPVEAKLQKEQQELNVLVGAITNVNTKQENRNDLIKEIQEKYPDFLKNLDTEKLTNEQLKTRLEEVNKQYEDRILLMIKEDMLQKNYKERTELKLEELDLLKKIAAYEITAAKAKEKIKGVTDPNQFRSILSQKEFDALNSIPIVTAALERNRAKVDELKKSEQDLNDALGQLRQNKPADTAPGSETPTAPDAPIAPLSDKQIKARIEQIEAVNNAEVAAINKKFLEEKINEDQFKGELLAQELKFLSDKMAVYRKGSKEYTEAQQQFTQKQVQAEKEVKDLLLRAQKELANAGIENMQDGFAKEKALEEQRWKEELDGLKKQMIEKQKLTDQEAAYNATIQATIAEKTKAHTKKINDIDSASLLQKQMDAALFAQAMAQTDQDRWASEEAIARAQYAQELKDANGNKTKIAQAERKLSNEIIRIKLDELDRRQQIGDQVFGAANMLFGALVNLADKESSLGKALFLFQQAAAVGQIIFNTGIANAKALAASPLTFGQPWVGINTATAAVNIAAIVAQTIGNFTGYSEGGHTGPGGKYEPAGIVHRKEYVIPEDGTDNPTVRQFIDIIEIARRNGSLARLDLRPVMMSVISGKGYSSGGHTSQPSSSDPSSPIDVSISPRDPELTAALNMNTKAIALLMKNGVQFPIVPFKKDLDEISDLLDQPGMPGFRKK
ncbi:MAG: phage tail tape measure protein [Prolixibacteraceae bacterium]|nr:phage tail tape measure protein [Prolixibacteraceae bacterium]